MVMKSFFMAILFTLVIKGVSYILCPKFVKNCSQKLMETPDIQLMHKISEELNTQNIQPPLIFYGLGRFTNITFEENDLPTLSEKKQVRVLGKIKNSGGK